MLHPSLETAAGKTKEAYMENRKPEVLQELLADLTPEELEPRLELQVFVDPMTLLVQANQNQNQNMDA